MPQEFTTLVSVCSGIAVILAAIKLVQSPIDDLKKLKDDAQTRKTMDRAILNSLQAITNHMIDGNGVEKLKASRDELNKTLNEIATK